MEEKFEFRDKRRIDREGNVKEPVKGAAAEAGPAKPGAAEERPRAKAEARREEPRREPPGEGLLVPFLMNLSAMAYMAMGMGEVPAEPNLQEAKFIIDVMGELEEKTKGNLTEREEKAFKALLYELRMNYAKVAERGRG